MNANAMGMLGLARRAGKLLLGMDSLEAYRGAVALILYASDASERVVKNCSGRKEPSLKLDLTKAELGHAVGCGEAAVVSLTDAGFAKAIRNKLDHQEENE